MNKKEMVMDSLREIIYVFNGFEMSGDDPWDYEYEKRLVRKCWNEAVAIAELTGLVTYSDIEELKSMVRFGDL